jgi:uncharacterized membrane protein (DUF2068 family)
VYWQIRGDNPRPAKSETRATAAAGLVTTVIASAIYIPLDVHTWVGGEGTSWGASVFLALCMGICQALLFRGRPLRPRPPRSTRSA